MAAGLGYKEFATGDVLTAADANGYLASQVVMVFADAAARTSAITSPQEGMISYLKDTNATQYYSGSAWLTIGAGSIFNGASVYGSAYISLANNTDTAITFNSEFYDTNSYHSTSTNTSRLTVPTTGYYLITVSVGFAANALGYRFAKVQKNGSTNVGSLGINYSPSGTYDVQLNQSIVVSATAADYFEIIVFQNSGGALDGGSTSTLPVTITYLGV
jgi:hypothetical protein